MLRIITTLPQTPRMNVTRGHGHGRDETRTHLVMDAPASIKAMFPHVRQVARVTRDVTRVTRSRTGKPGHPA